MTLDEERRDRTLKNKVTKANTLEGRGRDKEVESNDVLELAGTLVEFSEIL